ncbi:MAG: hypothetical protein V9G29_04480 [Burkholderiaceae bacterium]
MGVPAAFAEHATADVRPADYWRMQGDVTRVIAFQLARETEQPDLPGDRRPRPAPPALSHHGNDPCESRAHVAKINTYHIVSRLCRVPAAELRSYAQMAMASLLDHSAYSFTAAAWATRTSMTTRTSQSSLPVEPMRE